MKVDKLFQVLVVAGASSTAGLIGCGGGNEGGGTGGAGGAGGSGGAASPGGTSSATGGTSSATGGTSSATGGAAGGAADACAAKCNPNKTASLGTDCGGCCCWLAAGQTSPLGPICADEPCCKGRGR